MTLLSYPLKLLFEFMENKNVSTPLKILVGVLSFCYACVLIILPMLTIRMIVEHETGYAIVAFVCSLLLYVTTTVLITISFGGKK